MNEQNQIIPFEASDLGRFSITLTREALNKREDAIGNACLIVSVNSTAEQREAAETIAELKGFMKGVEAARVELKAPHLNRGKLIDKTASEAIAQVEPEVKRLEALVANYIRAERERVEKERQAAEKERLRLEAIETERLAKLAREKATREREERDRLEQIEKERLAALKRAEEATSAEEAEANKKEAKRIEQEQLAESLRKEFDEPEPEIVREIVQVAYVAPAVHTGGSFKEKWEFDVTDIKALYAALPNFVELTVKKGFLNSYINSGIDPTKIPGISVRKASKFAGSSKL